MLTDEYVENMRLQAARDDGINVGISKGITKEIALNKHDNAQKMIKYGLDAELVSKCTGLNINEVLELQKK